MKRRSELSADPIPFDSVSSDWQVANGECCVSQHSPFATRRFLNWNRMGLCCSMAITFISCNDVTVPKPRGYPRLDQPAESFEPWSGACPFTAEVPTYAHMTVRANAGMEDLSTTSAADTVCWSSLRFPHQRATVFMTYRRIKGDLPELIGDAHAFKDKHEAKAARIRSERILRDTARVFGNLFDVDGDVASPIVFYLTDSTSHFLYGSLYFDTRPNGDSLQPATDRIRSDMRHFAETVNWR